MSYNPTGSIYGFGQPQPQFNLATAGQGVAAPGYAESGQYTMPSYGGISQFGQQPQAPGGFSNSWLGKDGNLGTVFGGIQALGAGYLGYQQMKTAKENLAFQKQAYSTNLHNSSQTYNTSLADRIAGRTSAHAGKAAEDAAYLAANQLKTG